MPGELPPATLNSQERRFPEAYAILRQATEDHAFPGCAFGLLADGQILIQDSLGKFTYDADAPAVQPDTIYDIASITKIVATTAASMLLYQRGQLQLDLPLGELLPGFVIGRDSSEHARRVTIRHLLAHSSGLPGYVPMFQTANTPYAILRGCLQLPLEAEPGTRAVYSDHGFILLGKALEVLTQELLMPWVHREVFQPLDMTTTRPCPTVAQRPHIPPTEVDELFRKRRIQGEVQDEHAFLLQGAAGHAGLFSNVSDLLRFAAELQNPTLFTPETVALFSERQPPDSSFRALGFDTPAENSSSGHHFSADSIGHLGYSGCSLWIDRRARVAIALLTNRTWPNRESQQIRAIRPAFHDALRIGLGIQARCESTEGMTED